MSRKPQLSVDVLQAVLRREVSPAAGPLVPLAEGEESQAFAFALGDERFVLRINISGEGFEKDAYAFRAFASERLPIPEVVAIGAVDEGHAFCVSRQLPGVTLQASDAAAIDRLLVPTDAVLTAIHATDISGTDGFGDFDGTGRGRFATWREFLLSALHAAGDRWDEVRARSDAGLIEAMTARFANLVPLCPEERRLIHGDFGSNNVLTDGYGITGVLDWETAGYGDPVFDMGAFWAPWLMCMGKQAAHWSLVMRDVPDFHARRLCYDLRLGLAEIHETALDGDAEMLRWLEARCRALLAKA